MKYGLSILTCACVLVASCQTHVPEGIKAPASHPAATPVGTAASKAPEAPVDKARILRAPSAAGVTLSGEVRLDPDYAMKYGNARMVGGVVAMDGGAIAAADGTTLVNARGGIIAQGGGNVIVPGSALGGDSLISQDGASLVGNDGSAIITDDGGSLISHTGGGIITDDGGSLVGHGGSIITDDGGSLVARQGPAFRLLQAAGGHRGVPAAGMWVGVFDTHKGRLVPLGQDDDGKPAYAVYSDAQGHFTVHLPADVPDNVRVVALAPGVADERLRMHVLVPRDATATIDDGETAATSYMRYMLARKLYLLMKAPADKVAQFLLPGGSDDDAQAALVASVLPRLQQLKQVFDEGGVAAIASDERKFELALLLTDRVLADLKLADIKVDFGTDGPLDAAGPQFQGQPAVQVLADVLRQVQEGARSTAQNQDFAGYFAATPYVRLANRNLPPADRYVLHGPPDVADFVVRQYLTSLDDGQLDAMDHTFAALGLPTEARDAARGASAALYQRGLARLLGTDGQSADVVAQFKALVAPSAKLLAGEPAPTVPSPGPATPPDDKPMTHPKAWQVETVLGGPAGKPQVGWVDGPAATARLAYPQGLAARVEDGKTILYISEKGRAIRRATIGPDGATITTLAGNPNAPAGPAVDGGKDVASFVQPEGIVAAKDGSVYVCDYGAFSIRRLTFKADGTLDAVKTVAGGVQGFADGPGSQARFASPNGLVQDPASGDLFVADTLNHRIRRISLSDGQYTVTTVAGASDLGDLDATHASQMLLNAPMGLTFGPDGGLFLVDHLQNDVHEIASPVGPDARTSFIAGSIARTAPLGGFWANAQLGSPNALAWDPRGWFVVTTDGYNHVFAVTPGGETWSIAGSDKPAYADGEATFVDGPGNQARLSLPSGVAVTPDGTIWVADEFNSAIRRITAGP